MLAARGVPAAALICRWKFSCLRQRTQLKHGGICILRRTTLRMGKQFAADAQRQLPFCNDPKRTRT